MGKLIDFKDIRGYYEDEGSGEVLLLIHGYCGDSRVWESISKSLCKKFRVICPDLPGFGKSTLTKENLSVEWMAGFMHEIFDAENIDDAVMIGHSMGGYVALAFAEEFPDLLSGMGLIHSHCYADSDERKSKRKRAMKFLAENDSDGFVKELYKTLFTAEFISDNPEIIEKQVIQGMEYSKDALIAGYKTMLDRPDRRHVLQNFEKPVLFFSGKEDQSIDFELSLKQASLPKISDIHLLDAVGHMGMFESTKELTNAITGFVETIISVNQEMSTQRNQTLNNTMKIDLH